MVAKPEVAVIDISTIRENPVALRAVNIESEEFIGLLDSIKKVGLLLPINVRRQTDDVDGKTVSYYELTDGLQRYTACKMAGIKDIPAHIVSLDDAAVLEAQIMANIHRIETRPIEYTRQLQKIFAGNPTLTLSEMAVKVAKSPSWVSQRLSLLKLERVIQTLVNDGKITVSNAVQLSKLPPEEQVNYTDQALSMGSEEFVPLVQARVKELRDAARQGRVAKSTEFVPLPLAQKMAVLKSECEKPSIGPQLCKKYGAKDGPSGFALGVSWVLSLDPATVEVRKAKHDEKKAQLAEEKKKRAAERAAKKAAEATKAAAVAAEAVNA